MMKSTLTAALLVAGTTAIKQSASFSGQASAETTGAIDILADFKIITDNHEKYFGNNLKELRDSFVESTKTNPIPVITH